jgi:hypothetical protein
VLVPEIAKSVTSGHQNAALLMCDQKQYTLSGFWLKAEQAVNRYITLIFNEIQSYRENDRQAKVF